MSQVLTLLRRLSGEILHPTRRLTSAILLAASASISTVALLGLSGWLLSRASEHPPVMYLTAAAVAVRFFGITRGVGRYAERLSAHNLALQLQSALRIETYRKLARTSWIGRQSGDLLSRVTADVDAISDLVVRVIVPVASGVIVIAATVIVFAVFSPLSAVALAVSTLGAAGLAPWLARRWSRSTDAAAATTRGELAEAVHEISRCAPDLAVYDADTSQLDRIAEIDARLKAIDDRAAFVSGAAGALQVIASSLAVIGGLVIAGPAVASGQLRATMLAVIVLSPLALHEILTSFANAAQASTRTTASLARVIEVIDANPIGTGDRPPIDPADDPAIRLNEVTIGWPGDEPLAHRVTATVEGGTALAVTGRSGVGKSTLAATVLGVIPPVAGSVEVSGTVGYLAQDAHVFATSLAENVRIGCRDATDEEIRSALIRAGLNLDPDRVVGEYGATLSGGEVRRLALARLLVGEAQIYVLDEPTEHLDVATAEALLDDIFNAAADRPILVVTHDDQVKQRCDAELRLD
ncbi:MAG: thiol reductant ABC exporter subunit CydC [Ilumatobacter coccineus]|uniref:Thiol reductant ABC exporter subunit CydC n=1 Tax=Ilumatobacter coccineus TaxID=467094 RepID=A0A2G6K929_9ACTN|nr:MAG: thiol reductant ABC exporter subunit CydC [Ilumatobacter coccineus]